VDQEPDQVIIPLKKDKLYFEDIIKLEKFQLTKIIEVSVTKTAKEWEDSSQGVKIKLTDNQKTEIMNFKKAIIEGLTPQEFVEEDYLQVLSHAQKRINYRLEGNDSDLGQVENVKIAKAFFDAVEVKDAEWKGAKRLRYRFKSKYNNKEIELVLIFNNSVVVITIIVPKGGPAKKDPGFRLADIVRTSSWNKK